MQTSANEEKRNPTIQKHRTLPGSRYTISDFLCQAHFLKNDIIFLPALHRLHLSRRITNNNFHSPHNTYHIPPDESFPTYLLPFSSTRISLTVGRPGSSSLALLTTVITFSPHCASTRGNLLFWASPSPKRLTFFLPNSHKVATGKVRLTWSPLETLVVWCQNKTLHRPAGSGTVD